MAAPTTRKEPTATPFNSNCQANLRQDLTGMLLYRVDHRSQILSLLLKRLAVIAVWVLSLSFTLSGKVETWEFALKLMGAPICPRRPQMGPIRPQWGLQDLRSLPIDPMTKSARMQPRPTSLTLTRYYKVSHSCGLLF